MEGRGIPSGAGNARAYEGSGGSERFEWVANVRRTRVTRWNHGAQLGFGFARSRAKVRLCPTKNQHSRRSGRPMTKATLSP